LIKAGGKISDSIDENGSNHCMFWKKNLSKSTIFGILEQIINTSSDSFFNSKASPNFDLPK